MRLTLRELCLALAFMTAMVGAVSADPPAEPPATPAAPAATKADIQKWIAELGDDNYSVREAAMQKLAKGGAVVVEVLFTAANGSSLEVTSRAIRVLQTFYLSGDEQEFDAAEAALEKLTTSTNRSAARRASTALGVQVAARQKRAITRIQALGGTVLFVQTPNGIQLGQYGEQMVSNVRLGRRWKGGDAGLIHVKRLSGLTLLYIIKGVTITEEAIDALQKEMPMLQVQHRGEAMLGIGGANTPRGCEIASVQADTAADKAELEVGDVILKFGGKDIKKFEDVIELTGQCRAGDKVILEILRGEEKVTKEVELGDWSK